MALPVLETDRLLLRPFSQDDADTVQRLANDQSVSSTCQVPYPYTIEDALDWILAQDDLYARKIEMGLAITLKEDKRLIGAVTLTDIFENHQAELGFWIGKEFRGCGYASEAAMQVIAFAFELPLNLIRVHAFHMSRNPAAGTVLKNVGMKHEGTCPKHFMKNGIPEDIELWGILKE